MPVLPHQLRDVQVGSPETLKDQFKPILSNANIRSVDLFTAGLGNKIEATFREEIARARCANP